MATEKQQDVGAMRCSRRNCWQNCWQTIARAERWVLVEDSGSCVCCQATGSRRGLMRSECMNERGVS